MTRLVLPGSFDPFTVGHLDLARRAARLGDLTVAVSHNPSKRPLIPLGERVDAIARALALAGVPAAVVPLSGGLLADFCRERGITTVIKGLRSGTDLAYEEPMARMNRRLADLETLFVLGDPGLTDVSSSLVKEVLTLGGDVAHLLPDGVREVVLDLVRHSQEDS